MGARRVRSQSGATTMVRIKTFIAKGCPKLAQEQGKGVGTRCGTKRNGATTAVRNNCLLNWSFSGRLSVEVVFMEVSGRRSLEYMVFDFIF